MVVKSILDEDFVNYKKPSMFIATNFCTQKCENCQNKSLLDSPSVQIKNHDLIERYLDNDITSAIVFGGLEPFEQFYELYLFIKSLREEYKCKDDVVVYTGFNKNEIQERIVQLKQFKNVIVKFGRYIPNQQKHFDEILGIYLASDNQYAERIS